MTDNQHEQQKDTSATRIALRDDTDGDWEKANDRYFNAVKQNREIQNALNSQQQELQELKAALLEQRVNPTDRTARRSALAQLTEEYALPADVLQSAIEEVATNVLNRTLEPLSEAMTARESAVKSLGKEFVEHEADMLAWLAENKDVSDTYSALQAARKPAQAYKYAWDLYRAHATERAPEDQGVKRNAAGLSGGGGGSVVRNAAQGEDRAAKFDKALQRYRMDKDLRALSNELWADRPLTWAETLRAQLQEGRE